MKNTLTIVSGLDKATDEARMFIFKDYGEGLPADKIVSRLKKRFQVEADEDEIQDLCEDKDNRVLIDQYRREYLVKVKDVPVANKRIRLDDYQSLRDKLFEVINACNIKKKYGKRDFFTAVRRYNEVAMAVREEMEGKSNAYTQINITELSGLTDEELERRKTELIARAQGRWVGTGNEERSYGVGEFSDGDITPSQDESYKIPLASPEKL